MASSGIKKTQQKIFGTGTDGDLGDGNAPQVESPPQEQGLGPTGGGTGGQGHGLTVIIPKPKAPPTPPPRKTTSDPTPNATDKPNEPEGDDGDGFTRDSVPFRERMASKLGGEYKGAERYRLQQDDKREKHWKRWGPYLSDRQWVGFSTLFLTVWKGT